MTISDEEIQDLAGIALYDMALGDIHRALGCTYPLEKISEETILHDGQCLVGAVVLCLILMENVGIHYNENDPLAEFVKKFLRINGRNYDEDELKKLRNGLLHNYSTSKSKYVLTKNEPNLHLKTVRLRESCRYLNIQSFIGDIQTAMEAFKKDLANPTGRTKEQIGKHGILMTLCHEITGSSNLNSEEPINTTIYATTTQETTKDITKTFSEGSKKSPNKKDKTKTHSGRKKF